MNLTGFMLRTVQSESQAQICVEGLPASADRGLSFPQMCAIWGNRLVGLSYGLFLFLYVFAAADYGLTRESGISTFVFMSAGIFSVWLIGHALQRKLPSTGIWPWITSALVLAFGWTVTRLAIIDQAVTDGRLEGWDEGFWAALLLHGSAYDADLSTAAMLRTTALLGMALIAIEIWRNPKWSRALIATMIFSAFGMVLFFLLQKLVGGAFLLRSEDSHTTLNFGTYRYWGNAAAYLNLLWPIAAAAALFAILRKTIAWPLWLIPFAFIFAANFLNLSKAGNVLSLLGLGLFIALAIPICLRELKYSKLKIRKSHLLSAIIPIIIIGISLPFALPWQRWNYYAQHAENETSRGRLYAYSVFLKILPDSGWAGFGPGSFQKYYLAYVDEDSPLRQQSYWVAHQDYIQTAIEWGYIGTILWAFYLIPPGVFLLMNSRRRPEQPSRKFEGYRIGALDYAKAFINSLPDPRSPFVAVGATTAVGLTALHSMVDFPMQIASLQFYLLTLLALGWATHNAQPAKILMPKDSRHSGSSV